MRRRPIDNALRQAPSRLRDAGLIVVALIAAAASIAAAWIGPSVDGGAIAARMPASVEIARAHPGRQAELPHVPWEALSETDRASEDVEPDGASTYSWPQGIPAGQFGARACAGRDSAAVITNARKAVSSVDLFRLCRMLI